MAIIIIWPPPSQRPFLRLWASLKPAEIVSWSLLFDWNTCILHLISECFRIILVQQEWGHFLYWKRGRWLLSYTLKLDLYHTSSKTELSSSRIRWSYYAFERTDYFRQTICFSGDLYYRWMVRGMVVCRTKGLCIPISVHQKSVRTGFIDNHMGWL